MAPEEMFPDLRPREPRAPPPPAGRRLHQTRARLRPLEEGPAPQISAPAEPEPEGEAAPWRIAGEVLNTYIIVEQGDTILFIDKHAAHERMNFDRMKAEGYTPMVQTLLTPVTLHPPAEEGAALLANLPLLEEFGFYAEDFGGGALVVRQAPGGDGAAPIRPGADPERRRLLPAQPAGDRRHRGPALLGVHPGSHQLEDETLLLKSLVYKRDFTFNGGERGRRCRRRHPSSIYAVDAQIAALSAQPPRTPAASPPVRRGSFRQTDGYESLLTPALLETITPRPAQPARPPAAPAGRRRGGQAGHRCHLVLCLRHGRGGGRAARPHRHRPLLPGLVGRGGHEGGAG